MNIIRRSMMMCLLVFFVCTTQVLTTGKAQNRRTSKQDTNTLEEIPDPKIEEIRRIRRVDWPNPVVVVNADSFYLINFIDGERVQKELNLADLEKTLKELKLDRWSLGRVVAVQENGLRSPGDNEKIFEKSKEVKHNVGITQGDDRALALRLVAQDRGVRQKDYQSTGVRQVQGRYP